MKDFDLEDIKNSVHKTLSNRVKFVSEKITGLLKQEDYGTIYLAGGALTGSISDVDLFPTSKKPLDFLRTRAPILSETRNATTLEWEPWPVQLCYYAHDSLEKLVESFDYAHVQAGAELICFENKFLINSIYFTPNFLKAHASDTTWFCGTEFPLSSVVRAGKYYKKGVMSRGVYIRSVIAALNAMIRRGFLDYEDFKNQLDAVDLGLLPEDFKEIEYSPLRELFEILKKK